MREAHIEHLYYVEIGYRQQEEEPVSAHIFPLVVGKGKLHKEVNHEHNAHQQLKSHVIPVFKEVYVGERVYRYIHNQRQRQQQH